VSTSSTPSGKDAVQLVEDVLDPELPLVTIGELGMVREVRCEGQQVEVDLTPTYSGCPATEQIRADVEASLLAAGYQPRIRFLLAPAWSSDDISQRGRDKLAAAGIAPPAKCGSAEAAAETVTCPRCGSQQVRQISCFGGTACKAPCVCESCKEPFERFKVL